jgi:hypothetical protein
MAKRMNAARGRKALKAAGSRGILLRLTPALLCLAAAAGSGSAQGEELAGLRVETAPAPETARPDAYGTSALTLVTVAATDCPPIYGTTATTGVDGWVYPASGPGYFDCPLNLPAGARPLRLDILAHDASDIAKVLGFFAYCPVQAPGLQCYGYSLAQTTGTSPAPFDGKITTDFTAYNETVNKTGRLYFVRVLLDSTASDVQFRQVDVYYRLQISDPASVTPTFGDVPASHPYYKAIEALAASGITGGCGGGNFCPGNPVTRGEIAVFFARALGLHFPN